MITKIFETNRPVFFISDKDNFDFMDFVNSDDIYTVSGTTISITCMPVSEDMENTLNIYPNETYMKPEGMQFLLCKELDIPSKTLEVFESDQDFLFLLAADSDKVMIEVYVNDDYIDAPHKFDIVVTEQPI